MQAMSDKSYMQYEHESGVTARWHGGEYIELGHVAQEDTGPYNNLGQPSYEAGEFIAQDVINVWDYEKGKPYIPHTPAAMQAHVDKWMEERGE